MPVRVAGGGGFESGGGGFGRDGEGAWRKSRWSPVGPGAACVQAKFLVMPARVVQTELSAGRDAYGSARISAGWRGEDRPADVPGESDGTGQEPSFAVDAAVISALSPGFVLKNGVLRQEEVGDRLVPHDDSPSPAPGEGTAQVEESHEDLPSRAASSADADGVPQADLWSPEPPGVDAAPVPATGTAGRAARRQRPRPRMLDLSLRRRADRSSGARFTDEYTISHRDGTPPAGLFKRVAPMLLSDEDEDGGGDGVGEGRSAAVRCASPGHRGEPGGG